MATNCAFWVGDAIVGTCVGVAGVLAWIGSFAGDMVYKMEAAHWDLYSAN